MTGTEGIRGAIRFLLVEDSADLARPVRDLLAMEGHAVDWAASLAEADDCMAAAGYDLILLDIMLPDGDGRAFLARQRRRGVETPLIMLTARSAVADRVGALDQGADDDLTKPFDLAELDARIRAVLRRIGDIAFDPVTATLTVAGEPRE